MSTLTTTIQYSFGSSHPIYSTPSLSDTAGLGDAFALAARGDGRSENLEVQKGLKIRGFWFQKKTVQLKTVLREFYTYVLNEIFLQKTVYL